MERWILGAKEDAYAFPVFPLPSAEPIVVEHEGLLADLRAGALPYE